MKIEGKFVFDISDECCENCRFRDGVFTNSCSCLLFDKKLSSSLDKLVRLQECIDMTVDE